MLTHVEPSGDEHGDERGPAVVIGRGRERLVLRVPQWLHPEATDSWDGNWVETEVEVEARSFRGAFMAALRTDEFAKFRDGLAALHRSLTGSARLSTMEHWITLDVKGDGKGHFSTDCDVTDGDPGLGASLRFALHFDQTEIQAILRGLDAIRAALARRG
jgi:hypothetical protein